MILIIDLNKSAQLLKSLDRSKLVQRDIQVNTKHGTITRKQWVSPDKDKIVFGYTEQKSFQLPSGERIKVGDKVWSKAHNSYVTIDHIDKNHKGELEVKTVEPVKDTHRVASVWAHNGGSDIEHVYHFSPENFKKTEPTGDEPEQPKKPVRTQPQMISEGKEKVMEWLNSANSYEDFRAHFKKPNGTLGQGYDKYDRLDIDGQNYYVRVGSVLHHDKDEYLKHFYYDNKKETKKEFSVDTFNSLVTDRKKALDYLKETGVTWKESTHEGVNWMNARMAVNAKMGKKVAQPKASTATPMDSDKNIQYKTDVKALRSNMEIPQIVKLAKDNGVTWKESDNEGVNWMRCSMALQKHFKSGGTLADKKEASTKEDKSPSDDIDKLVDDILGTPAKSKAVNSKKVEAKTETMVTEKPDDSKLTLTQKLAKKLVELKSAHDEYKKLFDQRKSGKISSTEYNRKWNALDDKYGSAKKVSEEFAETKKQYQELKSKRSNV